MFRRLTAIASTVLALAACSAPSSEPAQAVPVTLTGAVQKGPFVLGSSVTVTPATATAPAIVKDTDSSAALAAGDVPAAASGQVFRTATSDDRGEFSLSLAYQGPALIEATGYYYNEAVGELSGAPLTLRALTSVGESNATTYVNLITHLTYQRVQGLMAGGTSFAEASAQAESELQSELGFGTATRSASELNLEGGDDADNAYLFAVSTVFAQTAYVDAHNEYCSNCLDGKMQELVNTAAANFATDGTLPDDTKAKLTAARLTIDNAKIEAGLADRLVKTGSTATVPDLDRVIPWSIPQSVTDCAAAMVQSVSEGCRMSLCGVDSRPLSAAEVQSQHGWQTFFSAASCGADCWATMQCFAQNCSRDVGGGHRSVDRSCTSCQERALGTDQLAQRATDLTEVVLGGHQCDADLGLAK